MYIVIVQQKEFVYPENASQKYIKSCSQLVWDNPTDNVGMLCVSCKCCHAHIKHQRTMRMMYLGLCVKSTVVHWQIQNKDGERVSTTISNLTPRWQIFARCTLNKKFTMLIVILTRKGVCNTRLLMNLDVSGWPMCVVFTTCV